MHKQHEIIVITGGLGPTSDDRTRFALARFLQVELIEYPEALLHIEQRLLCANLSMNAGNRKQALFPANATLLPNPFGTALGCMCRADNRQYFMLPGPPAECLPMLNHHVLPLLQQTKRSGKQLLKWRLLGVAEGEIAEILDKSLAGLNCDTGYRLETPYLEFKVRCPASMVAEVQDIVLPLIKPYLLGELSDKASVRLCQILSQLSEPVVIVDEATGGVLQTLLQKPETYQRVFFQKHENIRVQFHLSGLEEYWTQEEASFCNITIKYQNDRQQGSESYQLPYRSRSVIHHAAEWLCFRLLHLIDQLH